MSTTISNVMMVLNEAEFIDAAIRSIIPGLDQLIVIDQGSTDGTREILGYLSREFNFQVIDTRSQTFLTRGERFFRNLALDLCFCDWVMVSDGDEVMSDGWETHVRGFLDHRGNSHGAIRVNYHQLMGSSDYCMLDSPLAPANGERPIFFRMHDKLHHGDPMPGTRVHTPMTNIFPNNVARLNNVDCFHMGYAKNLAHRYERNITRGDWTQNPAEQATLLARAIENPVQFLPECKPVPAEVKARMPASIRQPRQKWRLDPETRRLSLAFP